MPKSDEPRVERGQRIIREVQFEPDPELAAKVRFVRRPAAPLPADEQTGPTAARVIPAIDATTDAAEVPPTGPVWEAREEDGDTD